MRTIPSLAEVRASHGAIRRTVAGLAITALILLAGCATPKNKPSAAIFFPPPPDEPRIQFLTAFDSEAALSGQSGLSQFVLGKDRVHRPLWKPYGLATTKGHIYICDTMPGNISNIDLNRNRLRYLRPTGQDAMQMPINVAVDKDGTRYVTDTKRLQVLIYGPDDRLVGTIGKAGEMKPCGIALAGDKLYVTDMTNHCVRIYNKQTREQIQQVPSDPKDEKSRLMQPTNIAVDQAGRMYVSDTSAFVVKIFDADGKHLRTIGDLGLSPGRFALPKGIDVDREGRFYVVDAATGVVQLFDSEGRVLMYFGDPKSGNAALYLPAGLKVDYENVGYFQKYAAPGRKLEYVILVANQAGPNKVAVYGFLARK